MLFALSSLESHMPSSKASKRLKRLAESGICSTDDASNYAEDLKKLADTIMSVERAEKKGRVFKALAEEIRLRILSLLTTREMCVCEVMVALDLTQPTASHHLGILETVGLVKHRKEGKWVFYRLSDHSQIKNMLKLDMQ
jgi:DNA-binding transcriptional ArsR family regulator